jgi:type II secretory pathway component PulF
MMNLDALWALSPLGLLLAVCLLLWFPSWVRQRRCAAAELSGPTAAMLVCCRILLVGILVLALAAGLFLGLIPGIVLGVVFIAAWVRYRRSEVRYLIWNLAEAAHRGIPLETVARAFANEQHGNLAVRARNLADYLDAGMPLSLALARSQLSPSPDVRLAADVGEKTGTLCPSLRTALQQMDEFERVLRATLGRFFYLIVVLYAMVVILTFLMLKIIPAFAAMFQDYGLQLPAATQVLIKVSSGVANYGFICLPVMALLTFGGIVVLLSYLGLSFRGWPIVGRFFSTIDNASVLRMLSVAVQEKRPLVGSLELLAAYAPFSLARSRLYAAIHQVTNGAHWCDALQRARLVTRAQATVFKSAERAGNLAWALDEMADSSIRRDSLRAQAALNVLFPSLILVCGMGVMFVAVGVLLPLFSLISKLT